MSEWLDHLHKNGILDALDLEFARFMTELAGGRPSRELLLGCALVSRAVAQGDVCLALSQHARRMLLWPCDGREAMFTPDLDAWRQALEYSRVVGRPGEFKPLVLDDQDRLYLYRYWQYETELATALRARAERVCAVDAVRLQDGLDRLFPPPAHGGADWQRVAAALAVLRGFAVISGGPGTGKTTTLAKILALLVEQADGRRLRIHLAAPTGKAAARVQEALTQSRERLAGLLEPAVLAALPESASTLHRLLGARPDGVYFRHDRLNPLNLDVLVIDEASMVDLALMTKTVAALPPTARLILLGDKDQLSSVEAGAVLGEICRDAGPHSIEFAQRLQQLTGCPPPAATAAVGPLADCVALLQHSYRFGNDSGIGALAKAVNGADEKAIRRLLQNGTEGIEWVPPAGERALLERLFDGYRPYLECVRRGAPTAELFTVLQDFRVLCAQRTGPTGVETLNARIEERLRPPGRRDGGDWYPGRPVMVTRNDYSLRLYNGDIGIALPDPEAEGRLRVYFQEASGGLRSFPTSRLPTCEPVFAMTVHKSQGSEFGVVLLVLPVEESPVLTRELIYTGLTRARRQVCLWAEPTILLQAVRKPVRRASGLAEALARPAVPIPAADETNAGVAALLPEE